MKKAFLLALVPLFTLMPSAALAASASLTVQSTEGRALVARYENLEGARLSVETKAGEVVKDDIRVRKASGTKSVILPKDMGVGEFALVAEDTKGMELARASFTLTHPKPTCRMTAPDKVIEKGEMLYVRWTSDNATRALLFGNKEVQASGRERIQMNHTGAKGVALSVFGKGGAASCSVKVKVVD